MQATLWAADAQGGVSAAAARAPTRHYSGATIAAAFGHLRRLLLINPGTARRQYHLTDRFKSSLPVGSSRCCRWVQVVAAGGSRPCDCALAQCMTCAKHKAAPQLLGASVLRTCRWLPHVSEVRCVSCEGLC